MTVGSIKNDPNYDPNALLNWFMRKCRLANDVALAVQLEVLPPAISRMRHRKIPIGPEILIRMHYRLDGIHISELRKIMGIEK